VSLSHRSSSNKKENTANPTSTDEHPKIEFNLGDFHLGSSRQRTNNAGTYKIDLNTAAQFMKKKRSVAENNANTFRENSTEKKNFFSFMGRSTSGQKSDPKTTLQTEVDTPKKKWRMFSFDRNSAKKSVEKLTTEANLAPTISGNPRLSKVERSISQPRRS
jgi:hypothetical protein